MQTAKSSKKKESLILERLDAIEAHLKKFKSKPLNAVEAAEYLSISLQHLYRLTSQRKIPHYKPARYLYFFEHELDEWICSNEKLKITNEKLEEEEAEEEPP